MVETDITKFDLTIIGIIVIFIIIVTALIYAASNLYGIHIACEDKDLTLIKADNGDFCCNYSNIYDGEERRFREVVDCRPVVSNQGENK